MENDPITMSDIVIALFEILISTAIGFSLFVGGRYAWIRFYRKISDKFKVIKDKSNYNIMLKTLDFSVINDDLKDILKVIKLESWEEPSDKKLVREKFIEEITWIIYGFRHLNSYETTAQRYYTFLTEGISGSVDNVSTVYLKTLLELRIEVGKKKYMSDEDKAEYKKREDKLIALIEEEINKNFEKVKEMKHSKNQSALDKADYIIKNGGIR